MNYTNRAALELVFGALNIKRWADLDGDADTGSITARIEYACELASTEAEDLFRERRYKIPLPASKTLTDLVTKLAGLHLHDARGVIDNEAAADTVGRIRAEVERKIVQIRGGEMYIDGERYSNAPAVVKDENSAPKDDFTGFDPFRPYFGQRH